MKNKISNKIDNKELEARFDYILAKIANLIVRKRAGLGITQDRAKEIGYSRRVIQRLESEKSDLTVSDLIKISMTFNVPMRLLVDIPESLEKKIEAGIPLSEKERKWNPRLK